jgi:hypothetical protein
MPVCNKCKKFSNCLTVDVCEYCGEKDWDEKTVLKPILAKGSDKIGRNPPSNPRGELKWRNTAGAAVLVLLALGADWLFVGTRPGSTILFLSAAFVLGTMAAEATREICSRLERIAEHVERSEQEIRTRLGHIAEHVERSEEGLSELNDRI